MEGGFVVMSALIAWIALLVSVSSYCRSKEEDKATLYLQLRNRYFEIRRLIPDRYFRASGCCEVQPGDWIYLEQYWYQSFDEWFSTTQLNSGKHKELWDVYFQPAVQSSLQYDALRYVVWRMTEGDVSFGRYRNDYRNMLDDLWKSIDKHHVSIDDSFTKSNEG